jgi:N-acetylmuramoyl-L-alanine amidase
MLAAKMGNVLRVLRGVATGLVLAALSQPPAANARVKQHHTTSAHAMLYPVPSHHRVNVRKTARTTVAQARPGNNLASRPLIVIDPGHGGRDPGAIGTTGTQEKTVTLAAALELRRQLEATGRYRVALTRSGDHTVSLAQRLAFARSHEADLLIAIHADASHNPRARGASVYVSSGSSPATHLPANKGNSGLIARALAAPESGPGSARLQYSLIEQLADDVRMVATPARAARLYVLGSRTLPSVLLEMGFLSNRTDEAQLRQPAQRRVLVQAVRDAIDDYFATIRGPTSRT